MSAFFSNQSFANVVCRLLNAVYRLLNVVCRLLNDVCRLLNVVCRLLNAVCRLLNAAKVETNTSFNQSLLTLFDLIICIHMLLVNIGDRLV